MFAQAVSCKAFLRTLLCLTAICLSLAAGNPERRAADYFVDTSIEIKGQQGRELLKLNGQSLWVEICNMKVGATYQLAVNPAQTGDSPLYLSNGKKQKQASRISLKATAACMLIQVTSPSQKASGSLPFYLSYSRNSMEGPSNQKVLPPAISTNPGVSATNLINNFFIGGNCYEVANITSSGNAQSRGTFANGSTSIGFADGIMLATGNISNASGPNNSSSTGNNFPPPNGNDPDLATIAGNTLHDVSIIEFDFTPTNDTVQFEYVFASEEYCEFVNSSFNDVFGFFLSGPGINGPYTNNAENIAVLPGSGTAVAINNVNHLTNSAYYIGNIPAGQSNCSGHPTSGPPSTTDCQYDGFTVVLTATAVVIPCSTYHIKLAIADAGDGIYDSAVFLKGNSFDLGGVAKVEAVGTVSGSNIIYEGCTGGYFEFTRDGNDLSQPVTITYTILASSTATSGLDYVPIPVTVTIPAGQTSVQIPVNAIIDNIPEGQETIILELDIPCFCSNPTVEIIIDDPPMLNLGLEDQELCSSQSVTLDPAPSGGVPGSTFTYNWSNGQTTPTITVTPPLGTTPYYVTVTDDCGNTAVDTANITIVEAPAADLSGSGTVCTEGNTNPVDLIISFTGTGPWEVVYSIDGVQQPPIVTTDNPYTLSINVPGTVSLESVINTSGNCPGTVSGSVQITETDVSVSLSPTNVSCNGANDGSINTTASGGTNPYSFQWDNSAANGQNPTNLPPGTYTVTVTDDNGCTGEASTTVQDVPLLESSIDNIVNIDCNNTTGSINLNVTGGIPPYSFQWDNGAGNSQNPSNLGPGTYTVTVTDANGCITTETATITEDLTTPVAVAMANDILTCDITSVTLNGTGSSTGPNFTYLWTTNGGNIVSGETTLTPIVNQPGTYTLTVTNADNGCIQEVTVTVGQDITPPIATGSAPPINCIINEVVINGSGSSIGPNFTYLWTTNNGNIISGETTLTPLVDQAGTYTLTVTNAGNGCESTVDVTVADDTTPPVATASANDLTCLINQITINGNGSSSGPGFTYLWTTDDGNILSGETTLTPLVDQAGTYTLTVTNGNNGCESAVDITVVLDEVPPIADAGPDQVINCGMPTAVLDGNGNANGDPVSYNWSTTNGSILSGGNTANPTVGSPGTYILTITNTDNGCTATDEVIVTGDFNPPTATVLPPPLITCYDPEVSLDGSNSTSGPNISYTWNTINGNIVSGQNSAMAIVDQAGTYTFTVTNEDNQCTDEVTVVVQENTVGPVANAGPPQELTCTQTEVPLIGAQSSIGPEFTYLWTTTDGNIVSGENSLIALVNEAGTYTLTVTNTVNGCTTSASTTVTIDEDVPVADAGPDQEINCYELTVFLQGANSSTGSNFSYQWSTTNGMILNGANTLQALVGSGGTYQLVVTNTDNGCTAQSTVVVTEDLNIPVIDIAPPGQIDCYVPEITLDASGSSNLGNPSIVWTTPTGNIVSGNTTLTPVVDAGGVYFLNIFNIDNGCSSNESVTVQATINNPEAEALPPDTITCAVNQIFIDASGSETGPGFVYNWTTTNGSILSGETTLQPQVSSGGQYELTILNQDNNCSTTLLVDVPEDQQDPIIDFEDPGTLNCAVDTLEISASLSGGIDFSFSWNTEDGHFAADSTTLNPLVDASGDYVLSVQNNVNGCTNTDTLSISDDLTIPLADAGPPADITCYQPSLILDGTQSDSAASILYTWTTDNGNILSGLNSLEPEVDAAGDYVLTVLNSGNQCFSTDTVTISENLVVPLADAGPDLILGCYTPSLDIDGSNSTAGTNILYSWETTNGNLTDGDSTAVPTVDAAGNYTLTVLDTINGCEALDSVTVVLNLDEPVVEAGPGVQLDCNLTSFVLQGNANGNVDDFSYQWTTADGNISNGSNTLSPEVDAAGTYLLTVLDSLNGCTGTDSVLITQDDNIPEAVFSPDGQLDCITSSIVLDGTASTQGPDITFQWTTNGGNIISGINTLSPEVNAGGSYTLSIYDQVNDCENTFTLLIEPDTLTPEISISPGLITCNDPELTLETQIANASSDMDISWTTANGNFVSGTDSLAPVINASGTYELFILNNENGCTDQEAVTIGIDTLAPIAEAGPAATITCTDPILTLNGNASAGGAPFQILWSSANGNILSGSNTASPSIDAPGDYQIAVTNTENGCLTIDLVSIEEDTVSPLAQAGNTDSLTCLETELNLNGSGSSTGPEFSYEWSTQDGTILNGSNSLNPLVNAEGTYTLMVLNNLNGCTNEAVVSIIDDQVYPGATIIPPDTLTCDQEEISLLGQTFDIGPLFEYQWNTADGNILSGANSLTVDIDEPGTYELLILNTNNGCNTTTSTLVEEDVTLPITEAGDPGLLTCNVLTINLDGTASQMLPDFDYAWSSPAGNIITGANTLNPAVDQPGWYFLEIFNNQNGCFGKDSVFVDQDIVSPAAEAGPADQITCAEPVLSLNGQGSSSGLIYTYQWSTVNGNILSGDDSLNPMIDQPGNYELLVTNLDNGCIATDQVAVDLDITPPTVAINSPELLTCAVQSIQINAAGTSIGPSFSYNWTTTNGNLSSPPDVLSPSVNQPGLYQLLVTNTETGCVDSLSVEVEQNTVAPTVEAGSADELTCLVGSLQLNATASGDSPNLSYLWTTSNGNIQSGDATLSPTINAPGIYELLVTDLENGCANNDIVEVQQDIIPPALSITPPGQLTCAVTTIQIDAQSSATGPEFTYEWTTVDGNILTGTGTLSPQVDQPGQYTLLIIDQDNGCTSEQTTTVAQNITPPEVDAGDDFVLPCFEEVYPLDGSAQAATGNLQIIWTTDDGTISSGQNSLTPMISAGGTYQLSVINLQNGCESQDEVMITEDKPENLSISQADPLCYGDAGALQVTDISGGTSPYTYSVDGGQTFQSGANFPELDPGQYSVIVQDANGCETEPEDVFIPEPIQLEVFLEEDVTIELGDDYQLQALVTIPDDELSFINWTPAESLSCSDCLTPIATPLQSTTYVLQVRDGNGCPAEGNLRIVVDRRPAVYVPNAFSPNGDGQNDVFLIFAKDESVVEIKSFLVFDRWGEMVYEYYNFQPNNPAFGWNGYYRGQFMDPAVFAWFAEIEFIDGTTKLFEGDVTLIK